MSSTSRIGHGKTLSGQSREIVFNVFRYFMQNLKKSGQPLDVGELYEITVTATGVSSSTIKRVFNTVREQCLRCTNIQCKCHNINEDTALGTTSEVILPPSTLPPSTSNENIFSTPGRKRPLLAPKSNLDDFDLYVIRRTIYDFHVQNKELPTLKKILPVLQEKKYFSGGITTLRQVIHKL